jgi:hypothetical protein
MERFHKIDDAAAITLARGVYRQSPLYRRGENLYVAYGSGFLRLCSGGGTSLPNVSWKEIDVGGGSYSEGTFSVTYTAPVAVAAE